MSSNRPHDDDPLAPHRGRLLGLAYRMLGSRSDAEDVVQDAYLRFAGAQDVHNAEAFLVTVVTRLCLDRLKSARAQREVYVGPWLPEPVVDAEGLSAEAATELADDLSFALLLALDRLSPMERAAFLLQSCLFQTSRKIGMFRGNGSLHISNAPARAQFALPPHRTGGRDVAHQAHRSDLREVCRKSGTQYAPSGHSSAAR